MSIIHNIKRSNLQKKSAVAMFTPGSAAIYQSVVNTARYLASQGYLVDIFTIQNDRHPLVFSEDSIKIYFIKKSKFTKILDRFAKSRLTTCTYYLDVCTSFFIPPKFYSFIIGFDPQGVITGGIISHVWRVPYIYHSLEINELSTSASWHQRFTKKLENLFSKKALFCLSQDKQRCHVLAEENGLEIDKLLVAYNSAFGSELLLEKDNYLRDKFNIPNNKYIVLAVGSLQFEHCIDQIVISVDEWPDNFVLVLHGFFWNPDHEKVIRQEIELRSEKVFLSMDFLEGDSKYKVFQSSDIGLVLFQPINKNFMFAAGSSGKLFDFMRVGVPVIANDIPGMREIVEEKRFGIIVERPKDIGRYLTKIIEDYEYLRKNAFESYGDYEFCKCYSRVLNQIVDKIKAL
jgi:glycosyltransferase involved in cell wall biosynthesis